MAKSTTQPAERVFVKKTRDGGDRTRIVTTPKSEVEARFDGFHEQPQTKRASTSGSGGGSTTSGSTTSGSTTQAAGSSS